MVVRSEEVFFKFEGRRGSCTKIPVEVKVLVKKPINGTEPPKMSEDEKFAAFQEWWNSNNRIPEPDEMHGLLNVDKYYRKYCKDKQSVDKIREIVQK